MLDNFLINRIYPTWRRRSIGSPEDRAGARILAVGNMLHGPECEYTRTRHKEG